jgi:(S)-2-hydroxyglutarate dehydrogenase
LKQPDFLIIGAGIVGIAIAKELKTRYPDQHVMVLEKEPKPGLHSSGRNSGVLHSGIYYPPSSLKAQVCSQGSKEMAAYCQDRGLPLNRIGKVLLPVNPEDGSQLDLLQERAKANGVVTERLDRKALKELEPEAESATGEALWVPSTAVGDSVAVMKSMIGDIQALGIELLTDALIVDVDSEDRLVTLQDGRKIAYGHAINSAGLHADSVAHKFDIGRRYTLLPFKGLYWKLSPDSGLDIRHLIYPVPDLRVPFLGVHTTTTTDGSIYLGPTAVPAFGRESYRGIKNITLRDFSRITSLLVRQTLAGRDGFRRLAWQEGRRYFKPWFADAARAILPRLKNEHLLPCDKVGIRAQMFDRQEGKLVTDFLVERGPSSTHVLNAISPAWTSAFPFARFVIDNYIITER